MKVKVKAKQTPTAAEEVMREIHAINELVHLFSETKIEKFMKKMRAGYTGWQSEKECPTAYLKGRLNQNIEDEDWVDVALLACMLWNRQE